MTGPSRAGLAYALGAAIVSGFAVFTNGIAVKRFNDPTVYTTAKNLIAGSIIVIAVSARARVSARPVFAVPRTSVPLLAVVALVGGAVPFVLFFEGLSRAASTNAAFIHKTLVVWVAIGAGVVLRERITAVHVGAIGVLLVGYAVLTGGPPPALGRGEAMILGATLLWSAEVLIVKHLLTEVSPQLAATSRMAGGSVLLLVWSGVNGNIGELLSLSPQHWAWLALTGTTLSVFVVTWYTALSLAPAVDVTAILVVGAVITGLLNTGFRGVPLTVDSYGYVLLVVGAAVVAAVHRPRQIEPATT